MNKKRRNAWLKHGSFSVYVRHASHMIEGQMSSCIDIANIVNYKEGHRGRGGFWRLIATIKAQVAGSDVQYIYIEQVLNKQLVASLMQRNYLLVRVGDSFNEDTEGNAKFRSEAVANYPNDHLQTPTEAFFNDCLRPLKWLSHL